MRFKEKVVLITGATQNTGLSIASLFIKEGALVIVNGISKEDVENGKKQLNELGLGACYGIAADISNTEQVLDMFRQISNEFGRIDILVNNAAHLGVGGEFEDISPDFFLDVLKVNLLGTFQVAQQAVKMMLNQASKGVIINIGSNISTQSIHNRTAYVTSKGGIDALTRSMAIDLAPKGIRVNMVAPGYIYSNRWETLSEEVINRRHANIPIRTEATGDDIAEAVAFLASDAAKNICGERLVVDGGCSAQLLPSDVDK
jgi:NAD(P)-dependent dehydrogenase (short-subunit alcohol dehydrogenase family)